MEAKKGEVSKVIQETKLYGNETLWQVKILTCYLKNVHKLNVLSIQNRDHSTIHH